MPVHMELKRIIINEVHDQQVIMLREVEGDRSFPIVIVTDGVFSMEGDLAKLPEIVELAERHGAIVVVDDSPVVEGLVAIECQPAALATTRVASMARAATSLWRGADRWFRISSG